MLLTVKITFKDGTSDIKECWSLGEICLDNVINLIIIRQEKIA